MNSLKICFKTLGACLIIAVFLEGVLRVLCFSGLLTLDEIDHKEVIHKYADNPKLIYDMKPSFRVIDPHDKEVKTNSYGMRDREYTLEKPEGVYRIAVVGDSIAFGAFLEHALTFEELLERKLNAAGKAEVLNFSISGYNAYQEEIILKERVHRFAPDLVIVAYCLNDDSYTDGLGVLEREMAPAAIGPRLHSKLLTLILHRLESGIFAKGSDTQKVERLFSSLKKGSEEYGYKTFALIFPYNYMALDQYDEINKHRFIRELLREKNIPWIDFLDVWQGKSPQERKKLYKMDDKVHLSRMGMREVSEVLYAYILDLIASAYTPPLEAGMTSSGIKPFLDTPRLDAGSLEGFISPFS